MEGPRPINDAELPEFIAFLSGQLRPNQDWSIAQEYPLAMHHANANNIRVIKSAHGFESAAVMKPLVVKSPAGLFKVAAIGSVVTRPESRNQGLSNQVLQDCLNAARMHGCDFAILWTNLYDFYRKIGFELAGTEVALRVPENLRVNVPDDLRCMATNRVDPEAILRLYSQHTTGTLRTADDIRHFLTIPNARVFTAWDGNNQLQAYAVEGKGADLDAHIHEWGGGVSKLLALLKFAVQHERRALNLIAPAHSTNLIRQMKAAGCRDHQGVLGMVKILNPSNFLLKMKKHARASGAEDLVMEPREGRFYLGHGSQIFSTDSEADLVKLFFGPLKASQLGAFDPGTAEAFERVFPIPMWIWGWDSV